MPFWQVVAAVTAAIGSGKVGVRLSPYAWKFNSCHDPDVASTVASTTCLLKQLNKFKLAYVHILSARADGMLVPGSRLASTISASLLKRGSVHQLQPSLPGSCCLPCNIDLASVCIPFQCRALGAAGCLTWRMYTCIVPAMPQH